MSSKTPQQQLNVIEFFSGIGGMHYALKSFMKVHQPHLKYQIIKAFDFSTTANEVYHHNHPNSIKPSQKPIQQLNSENLKNANMWMMSPPCQPYTRQNETTKRDLMDKRSSALIHLCKILDKMSKPPTYFLLENVVNFEVSDSCKYLLKVLKRRNYHLKLFKLSPEQFGIPNTRPRIFIVGSLLQKIPEAIRFNNLNLDNNNNNNNTTITTTNNNNAIQRKPIKDFLETKHNLELQKLLVVSKDTLSSNGSWSLDIVTPSSNRSACFTHSYYRFMKGTGSIICIDDQLGQKMMGGHTNSLDYMMEEKQKNKIQKMKKNDNVKTNVNDVTQLQEQERKNDWYGDYIGKLRYFSPKEIVNLLGFPSDFEFPMNISLKKQYALAGNSLHVLAVKELLKLFFP